MQTKSLFMRPFLATAMLLLPSACGASGGFWHNDRATHLTPSRTGALLGALVSIRRHNVSAADHALVSATQLGAPAPLRDLALLYALTDLEPDSAKSIKLLAAQQPDAALSRFAMGTELLARNDWWGARQQFVALKDMPHSVFADISSAMVALTYYAQGDHDKALDLLTHGAPTSGPWLDKFLMMRLLAAEKPSDARLKDLFEDYNQQVSAPIAVQIWFAQFEAAWLAKQGHRQDAVMLIDRLKQRPQTRLISASIKPEGLELHPSVQLIAAELLFLHVSVLVDATSMAESDAHAPHIDPDTLQLARRYEEAILSRALYLAPRLSLARLELAQMQVAQHHVDEADKTLSSISADDAYFVAASAQRLDIALQKEDLSSALQELQALNTAFPHDIDLLTLRASVEMDSSQPAAALKHCDKALELLPPGDRRRGSAFYCRGSAYDKLGQPRAAQQDFKSALQLDPNQPGLLNNIGYHKLLQGDAPEASLKLLKRAHQLAPDSVEANDSYGWGLLIAEGDVKAALPLLTRAIEKRPDDPEIGYHLGVAYWYHGMQEEARIEWARALTRKPDPQLSAALQMAREGRPPPLGRQNETAAQHRFNHPTQNLAPRNAEQTSR